MLTNLIMCFALWCVLASLFWCLPFYQLCCLIYSASREQSEDEVDIEMVERAENHNHVNPLAMQKTFVSLSRINYLPCMTKEMISYETSTL